MNKFLVLYMMPSAGMQEWMQKPEAERKEAEDTMKAQWDQWSAEHAVHIIETAGAGKTTEITTEGTTEISNDIMLYSMVQGESKDAVAQMFVHHPHLGIPGATIQIMPANVLPGMQK